MAKETSFPTSLPKERTLLVGVEIFGDDNLLPIEESLAELERLAETDGLNVVGTVEQRLSNPNSKTYIGAGKVEEVQALLEELNAEIVLFDNELNPRHQRELEKIFSSDVRVLDRTALILDIFAQHANTHEGSLQVELAQYEYRLPRLTRAWTHLARQAGGGGGRSGAGGVGLRGPGEKQLEVDRRDIHRRINFLKAELEKVRVHRGRHRARRKKSRIPVIALVGYTNAGKSTLLNQISGADVYIADQLFATLDPTTRRVDLPGGTAALFTDTVGFIQKLPTTLVAAFRATLEEIAEADLLLHVVDVTHPSAQAQAESVLETLEEIEADHIPVLTVLNKIDRLGSAEEIQEHLVGFSDTVGVSALTGEGIPELLEAVHRKLFESLEQIEVMLPYQEGALTAIFHEQGQVEQIEHTREGVRISGRIPGRLLARFKGFREGDETQSLEEEDDDL
ncbi:GTPase HflX [bacterium]|nr:GTPase HflX [bacterium]MCB2179266.1 GTPase HflX [bacterium]